MHVLRPAGYNERRCISRDVLGQYGSIVVCATYTGIHTTNQLPVDDIIRALKQCIIEHPVLCTTILAADTENPQLARPSSMNLDDHLRILGIVQTGHGDGGGIQPLLEEVHNERLRDPHRRPPWRLYVLPLQSASSKTALSFRLAFACSHALADGISGFIFHQTMLYALHGAQDLRFDSHHTLDLSAIKHLLPPVDRAGPMSISWSFLLGPLLAEYLPPKLAHLLGFSSNASRNVWVGASTRPDRPTPPQLLCTALRLRTVQSMTLQRVLAVCRSRKVRLTGLLVQLIARALASALRARGQEHNKFVATTVIDLRRCLPIGKGCMANYASATSELLTVSTPPQGTLVDQPLQGLADEDWIAARRLTEHLGQASSSAANQPVALLKYLSNFRSWTIKNAQKPSDVSFEVSNLGVFDRGISASLPQDSMKPRWDVGDIVFSQSADAGGAPFSANIASTEHGPLAIVFSWWPGMLGVEDEEVFADEICSHIESQLRSIV